MKLFQQYRGLRRENYVLFFGNVVTNMGSMIWPMMTMILDKKLGMSAGALATLLMVGTLICMPANLLGGRLADKRNKKTIIIVGDLVSITCYILCGLVPLSTVTIVLIMVASVFQSIEGPAYNALLADITPTRDREKAYSLMYVGGNLGLMISPTLSGLLFKNYLWLAFTISGVAIGCSTVLIWFLVRDITPVREEGEEASYQVARQDASVWRILWENKAVLLFCAITALYFAAYNQFNFLMPLEMGRYHGENGAVIFGTVSSLNCVVVVLFTPLITRLFQRIREVGKLLVGEALVAAGYLLFLLLMGKVPVYYAAMLLFTWGEIFSTISEGPFLSNRMPASHRGRVNGLTAVLGTAITGAVDLTVGHLYDSAGRNVAWGVVMGVLALTAALTVLLRGIDRRAYPKLYARAEGEKDGIEADASPE